MQFVYRRLFFSFLTTNLASEKKKIIFSLISYPRPLVVVVKKSSAGYLFSLRPLDYLYN